MNLRSQISILVLLALVSPAHSAIATPKKSDSGKFINDILLRRDYRKADAYIKAIVDEHEQEFPGALSAQYINFRTEFDRLSYIQQGILTDLLASPKFRSDMATREPLTDLTFTVMEGSHESPTAQVMDRSFWLNYQFDLTNHLRSLVRKSRRRSVQGLLEALRADAILSYNNMSSILPWSHEKRRFQNSMAAYVMTSTLSAGVKSLPELYEKIEKIEPGALDYLKDAHNFQTYIDEIKATLDSELTEKADAKIKDYLSSYVEKTFESLYPMRTQIKLKIGEQVKLREVHPNLSILRGYVGNDCATAYSPGFVFTPYDRYFYAYDTNEKILGYVGVTNVIVEGEKALYLHTIQGPGFTSEQAQIVMTGVQEAASVLGVKRVLMGSDSNIHANINFPPITRAMVAAVAPVKQVSMTWLDRDYRKTIGRWDNVMTYDDPDRSEFGRELPKRTGLIKVESSQKPFEPVFKEPILKDFKNPSCELRLMGLGLSIH